MKKGEIVELEIEDYAFEGKGIARIHINDDSEERKFVVFVNGAYPGDVVETQLRKVKKRYAEGKAVRVIKASGERVEPKCNFFGTCGGCKQQDLKYTSQIKYKEAQVKELFEIQGGFTDFEMQPILGAEKIFAYRNKMEFSFADKRWITVEEAESGHDITDKEFALGLHIPRIFDKVLDINECFLHNDIGNKILNFTREFFKSRGVSIYSTKTHAGYLRNLVIKIAHHTNDIMVNLVTSEDNTDLMNEFTEDLLKSVPEVTTIINNINEKKSQVAIGDYEKVYFGSGNIYDTIGKYRYRISANSFFQTNTLQAELLYNTALEYADLKGDEIVYDLYSGAGTISIYVSDKSEKVFAIESVEAAVNDAHVNAELNEVSNLEFILGDLNKSFLPVLNEKSIPKPDVIIADPPRSGMNPKTVKDIIYLAPKKIVYVSCNPTTQMRDIKLLTEEGYKLIKMKPVDMFPHTYHIENVALLSKQE